jgi:glycosyltransferase involved in cell wall biosynthesis
MKVAILLLTQNRHDLTQRVINQNFFNSGYDADCFLIDNGSDTHENYGYQFAGYDLSKEKRGIAAGVNAGLRMTENYDAVCLLANDILLPQNWLANSVLFSKRIEHTGIIGIHCVEALPPLEDGVHKTHTPFGDNFITRELIDAIGGYNTEYDPYGMQDSDYAARALIAGFTNYYLPDMRSEHIGHDVGNGTDYRRMKDESFAKAKEIWDKNQDKYQNQKNIRCEYFV